MNVTLPAPAFGTSIWTVRGSSAVGANVKGAGNASAWVPEKTPFRRTPVAATSRVTFWAPVRYTCHVVRLAYVALTVAKVWKTTLPIVWIA